jgi:pre-mRNA-splicing factor CWC26
MLKHSIHNKSTEDFSRTENILKRERENAMLSTNSSKVEQEETVYRDKRGKKLDMLNEFMRQQSNEDNKKLKLEQAQFEWGKGTVQKRDEEEYKRKLLDLSSQPFARTIDDPKLETMRKTELRDGDPMFDYFQKKSKVKNGQSSQDNINISSNGKPLYEGPLPTPNR